MNAIALSSLGLLVTSVLALGGCDRARQERFTIVDAGRVTVVDNAGVGAERSAAQNAPEVTVYGYADAGGYGGNAVELTAGQQSLDTGDTALTQKVRAALGKDGAVANAAKTVKLVAEDGVLTLRGTVKTAHEKAAIEADAKKVPGVKSVDNQLEIESKSR